MSLIREVIFKNDEKSKAEADRLCKILDKESKVLSTRINADGNYCMVVNFEDGLDMLAFMCATGMAKIVEPSEDGEN